MLFTVLTFIISAQTNAADIVMKHMPEGNSCIICHQAKTPEHLLLRDGTRIESSQVNVQCGQCHGVKYRMWNEGRHGKVTGSWQVGVGKRLACIHCHDPHAPKFLPMNSIAPPPSH